MLINLSEMLFHKTSFFFKYQYTFMLSINLYISNIYNANFKKMVQHQQFFSQTLNVRKSSKPHKFFMHASFFTVQDWGEFSAQVSQQQS